MRFLRAATGICLTAAILLAPTSCADNGDPSSEIVSYDIVRLESQTEAGAVFSLQKPLATQPVTYTTAHRINTDAFPIGNRLLIAYVPVSGVAYTSGEISLRGVAQITNSTLQNVDPADIPYWADDAVWLLSAWRSGNYLNIHARLPYGESPRQFGVACDTVGGDPSWPDLYLVHSLSDEAPAATFDRAYYASFDISPLTTSATVRGFTLHLNNSNLRLDAIPFTLH